jgi:hypothetical protein
VQVLQHQHDRPVRGQADHVGADALPELEALGVVVTGARSRGGRGVEQPAERGRPGPQRRCVLVLGAPPEQYERARVASPQAQLGREPRLPGPGVADQHREGRGAGVGRGQQRTQGLQVLLPPDQRPVRHTELHRRRLGRSRRCRRRGCGGARRDLGLLAQDRGLQVAHDRGRLDPQLVVERVPQALERGECVGLAAGP